jgi:hypothetical protein
MNVYQNMLYAMRGMGDPQPGSIPAEYTKPGGGATGETVYSGGSSQQNIRALQQAIVSTPGCSLPQHGVDSIWGPETRAGTQCLAGTMGGLQALYARYPFAQQLMGQAVSSGGGGGGGGAAARPPAGQQPPPGVQAASIFRMDSPWLWAIIAGVLVVGGGVVYYMSRDEDLGKLSDDELERRIFEKQIEAGVGTIPATKKQ